MEAQIINPDIVKKIAKQEAEAHARVAAANRQLEQEREIKNPYESQAANRSN